MAEIPSLDEENGAEQTRPAVLDVLKKAEQDPSAELSAFDPEKQAAVDDMRTDTKLKTLYAYWFIGILIGQLVLLSFVFIAVGYKWLNYDNYVLHLYLSGTLLEVFGVVLVITKYLFSRK
jgi:hypothetical protein